MVEGFHGFVMFSLSLSKIGNAKETLQKMLARKDSYRYRGKYNITYEGLKISVN